MEKRAEDLKERKENQIDKNDERNKNSGRIEIIDEKPEDSTVDLGPASSVLYPKILKTFLTYRRFPGFVGQHLNF